MTSDQPTLAEMAAELATLRARIDAHDAGRNAVAPREPISRRGLLMGLAGAGAAGVATIAGAAPAGAADGDNLILGQENESSSQTSLTHTATSDQHDLGLLLESDAWIGLAVTNTPNPDLVPNQYAIWARQESTGLADSAIRGETTNGFAFEGFNEAEGFPTIVGNNQGTGAGLGGVSQGHGPQLWLDVEAGAVAGPPSGQRALGQIRLDAVGDLWVCVASGDPGTWTRLLREDTTAGHIVPIAPLRALDTRATGGRPAGSPVVPGQKAGPLKGGTSLTLDLAGVGAIPATAAGVAGNLTVVSPTYAGYLGARPSGAPNTTSSINFTTGAIVANAVTSGLGPDGLTITGSGTAANSYHLIVDITAYLT